MSTQIKVSLHTVTWIWMEFLDYATSKTSLVISGSFFLCWHSINLSIGLCLEIHKHSDECLWAWSINIESYEVWNHHTFHLIFLAYFAFQKYFNVKTSAINSRRKQLNCVLLKFMANLVILLVGGVRLFKRLTENSLNR